MPSPRRGDQVSVEHHINRRQAWTLAIRPQTLPAGAAPVVVGVGVAWRDGVFAVGPAIAALAGAILIQIGTNLANDYYDAAKGVDTDERTGFTRVTQSGLLPAHAVKRAMWASFAAAVVIGCYLAYIGGIPIVLIGIASIVAGITYAGGPLPFGSYGLGDLFVFIFFGLIGVSGTYYVQAVAVLAEPFPVWLPPGTLTSTVIIASIPIGCLTTAILVVNNYRDIESDATAGKRTLAVLIGPRATRIEFLCLVAIAFVVPAGLVLAGYGWSLALPLLVLPYAGIVTLAMLTTPPGPSLNRTLEQTGKLLTGFAVLFAVGVILA